MKRLLRLFLAVALVLPLTIALPAVVSATTTVYDDDQSGWEAAVGTWQTEDFTDATLNPGLSVVSDFPGHVDTTKGVWWDRLVVSPPTTTTWQFDTPIHGFGATWNPGVPGGPGASIAVKINGSWVYVGQIPGTYVNIFWGFVSDVPFTEVLLEHGTTSGWCETYEMDDLVYGPLPQYLTGGGQIVTDTEGVKKKNQYRVSFAGILGYTGDLTLMGQYQFHLHNVSEDTLDGAIFHSISVSQLVFGQDTGEGPAPPPAEANVAYYQIDGRLKMKGGDGFQDGYTIYAYVADRGEPGKNDSINFALWQGATILYSSTYDFPIESSVYLNGTTVTTKLDAGNLQIHAEY